MPRASIGLPAGQARPGGNSCTPRPPGSLAVDFLHAGTVLLNRLYVLVFIEHGTRRMHLGGVTANPTGEWTVQQALTLGERFEDIKFLIRDRGSNFTRSFDAVFQATGARILRTAVQAPRMNATCERIVGTLRRELLDRVLILGERHLRAVLAEYQVHYNTARPHQGIAQRVPDDERDIHPATVTDVDTADPPKTRPQRPDQRICARRLTPGRPAGHLPKSYFRAGQGDIGVGQSSLRLAKPDSGEPPTGDNAGAGAGEGGLFGGGGGSDGSSGGAGSGSESASGAAEADGGSGTADSATREQELAFTLMCSLTDESKRDNVRLLLRNLANAIDEGRYYSPGL